MVNPSIFSIHVLAIVALLSYILYSLFLIFQKNHNHERRFTHRFFLAIGIACNLLMLVLLFSTDLLIKNNGLEFESHPALILLFLSFAIFSWSFVNNEKKMLHTGSLFFVRVYSYIGLFLYIVSVYVLHDVGAQKVYQISPELLIHIILSLIAQGLIIVVLVLSISLFLIEKSLRSKNSLSKFIVTENNTLPALMPTQELWIRVVFYAIVSYLLSIGTGIMQLEELTYSAKLVFPFLYLLGLIIIYFAYKKSNLSMFSITLISSSYIIITLIFQILFRLSLFN